jgi:hypothetical protein
MAAQTDSGTGGLRGVCSVQGDHQEASRLQEPGVRVVLLRQLRRDDRARDGTIDALRRTGEMNTTPIRLRAKYRPRGAVLRLVDRGGFLADLSASTRSGGAYRTRTGPVCCNAGCPSGRRKGGNRTGKALK